MLRYFVPLIILFCYAKLVWADEQSQPLPEELVADNTLSAEQISSRVTLIESYLTAGHYDQQPHVRLEAIDKLVQLLRTTGRLKQAEQYNLQLLGDSVEQRQPLYQIRAENNLGNIAYTRSNYLKAIAHFKTALSLAEQTDSRRAVARANLNVARGLRAISRLSEVQPYAQKGLTLSQQVGYLDGVLSANTLLSQLFEKRGQYDLALSYMQKNLALETELNDERGIASTLYNIGSLYIDTGDFKRAESYFNQALNIDKKYDNASDIGHDYMKLGILAGERKQWEQSTRLLLQALEKFKSIDANRNQGWALINLGRSYTRQGQYLLAEGVLKQGIDKATTAEDKHLVALGQRFEAELAGKLKQFDRAHALVDRALVKAIEEENLDGLAKLYLLRSELFELENMPFEALKAYKESALVEKKLFGQGKNLTIGHLQASVESLNKEHKISLLEKDRALQQAVAKQHKLERNRLITVQVFSILILIGLILYLYSKRRVAQLKNQVMEEAIARKNNLLAEVSHELRTPLAVLKLQLEGLEYDLVDDRQGAYRKLHGKIAELNQLIHDIYQLARADSGLLELNFQTLPALELLEEAGDEFQELGEDAGFDIEVRLNIDAQLHIDVDAVRFKQVLVNLLRNSIRYTDTPGCIRLLARQQAHELHIRVEDSAPGVMNEDLPRLFERLFRAEGSRSRDTGGSGLGLSICKSLVEAHSGTIAAARSKRGGLRIDIRLPISTAMG
ncbi:tetratricopeptide repeat protein [Corallincola spongiicola]|uniref:histidine kinase n=1 Tax=Corallincola spongiicola TaxID=2520508 RepID=A0ABY1WT21_9GAMM|nr:tetratricopeptide repeat protein [Corallincola spongiicola]TAA47891.1 tetratricopeptide repeat protein [Corallincola spongiicola]